MSIGIFDSGVGGLTVLKEVLEILPNEEIYYFGDTGRVPYGNKTQDLIIRYSKQITDFLIEKKVDVIVVACNTATALALEELKKTYKIPIIGVIDAGVKTVLEGSKNSSVGVIATKATISSNKYEIELRKLKQDIKVINKACPLLVPVIEEGIIEGELVDQVIKMYLDDFANNIDSLILGCTHYPLLRKSMSRLYNHLEIVDPAKETALHLKKILIENNLLEDRKDGFVKYYVSDGVEKFKSIGNLFLKHDIDDVELVKLN